jgi:hypothetical protein
MDPDKCDADAKVTLARTRLQNARSALDVAVGAMPEVVGEETMAPPSLLLLLIGAVRAKEHLDKLEALLPGPIAQA